MGIYFISLDASVSNFIIRKNYFMFCINKTFHLGIEFCEHLQKKYIHLIQIVPLLFFVCCAIIIILLMFERKTL